MPNSKLHQSITSVSGKRISESDLFRVVEIFVYCAVLLDPVGALSIFDQCAILFDSVAAL